MSEPIILDNGRYRSRACAAMDIESLTNTMGAVYQILTFASGDSRRAETWVCTAVGWELTHTRRWIEVAA